MNKHSNLSPRRLVAAVVLAGAQFAVSGAAHAQAANDVPATTATATATTSQAPAPFTIKQINAGVLNVGYVDEGPADGPVVILLHGWPYDIYSYADVVPILTKAGYRVIVPYLRGYGTTRFLDANTPRDGEPARRGVGRGN